MGLNNSPCSYLDTNGDLFCLPTNHFQCNNDKKCRCDFPYLWVSGTGTGSYGGSCSQCETGYQMIQKTCGSISFYFISKYCKNIQLFI